MVSARDKLHHHENQESVPNWQLNTRLALFTILFEDVPQIVLTLLISKRFEGEELTPLSAFNIATSVYSALIKVSGPIFLNSCYCCTYEGSGVSSRDVEFSGGDYHEA